MSIRLKTSVAFASHLAHQSVLFKRQIHAAVTKQVLEHPRGEQLLVHIRIDAAMPGEGKSRGKGYGGGQ